MSSFTYLWIKLIYANVLTALSTFWVDQCILNENIFSDDIFVRVYICVLLIENKKYRIFLVLIPREVFLTGFEYIISGDSAKKFHLQVEF